MNETITNHESNKEVQKVIEQLESSWKWMTGKDNPYDDPEFQKLIEIEKKASFDKSIPSIGLEIETPAIRTKNQQNTIPEKTGIKMIDEMIRGLKEFVLPPSFTADGQWLHLKALRTHKLIPSGGIEGILCSVHAHFSVVKSDTENAMLSTLSNHGTPKQSEILDKQDLIDKSFNDEEFREEFGIDLRQWAVDLATLAYMKPSQILTFIDKATPITKAIFGLPDIIERDGFALNIKHTPSRIKGKGGDRMITWEARRGKLADENTLSWIRTIQNLFTIIERGGAELHHFQQELHELRLKYPHLVRPTERKGKVKATMLMTKARAQSKMDFSGTKANVYDDVLAVISKYNHKYKSD